MLVLLEIQQLTSYGTYSFKSNLRCPLSTELMEPMKLTLVPNYGTGGRLRPGHPGTGLHPGPGLHQSLW